MFCLTAFKSILIAAVLLVATSAMAQIVSPDVHPDHSVTFRLKSPGAKKVDLYLEGRDAMPMTMDLDGVWSITTPVLVPDIYGYGFSADGVDVLDTSNPLTKPNLIWQGNMVIVPGDPPALWEMRDVPHGLVHHHIYHSAATGAVSDFYVYTPPGYENGSAKNLPVLYLLHGYSDMASGWSAVGMANLIMDNMIAEGNAKPMVMVMPLGYGVPNFASPIRDGASDPARLKRNYDQFQVALLNEVMPTVEKEYRVSKSRNARAITGLSMGGAESLYVGLRNLDRFAYIGSFSAGDVYAGLKDSLPIPTSSQMKPKVLWVACGTDDDLISINRKIVAWLKDGGLTVTQIETPGRHAWPVWRRNLIAFSSLLFR
jgi:enterochelin esterase family protein